MVVTLGNWRAAATVSVSVEFIRPRNTQHKIDTAAYL